MKIDKLFELSTVRDEFRVWTQLAKPELELPQNVLSICEYGFTEVLNNVIDHAMANHVAVRGEQGRDRTVFEIEDDGAGLFARLKNHFHLDSDLHALIELVKGKLTIAPEAHSGEGLFFASKMFDRFVIESGELSVVFEGNRCAAKTVSPRAGTLIRMEIANNSPRTTQEVFNQFCDTVEFAFYKTRFALSLAEMEGNLISRSQAKRVASRFEMFNEVELDFSGVSSVGQAFADELLRVWPLAHPHTRLETLNANESVLRMISHVSHRGDLPQAGKQQRSDDRGMEP